MLRMTPQQLKDWRQRHKLSQTAAGEAVGKDRITISKYERGESAISVSTVIICKLMDTLNEKEQAMGDSASAAADAIEEERVRQEKKWRRERLNGLLANDGLAFRLDASVRRLENELDRMHLTTHERNTLREIVNVWCYGGVLKR